MVLPTLNLPAYLTVVVIACFWLAGSSAGYEADIHSRFWNKVTPMIASTEVAIEIVATLSDLMLIRSPVMGWVCFDAIEVKVMWFLLMLISLYNERSTFPAKCE
jgi:hypothetical protein